MKDYLCHCKEEEDDDDDDDVQKKKCRKDCKFNRTF